MPGAEPDPGSGKARTGGSAAGRRAAPAITRRHRIEAALLSLLLGGLCLLPYRWRVPLGGRLGRALLSVGTSRKRIGRNLQLIFPDRSEAARQAIGRAAADNIGRVVIEVWSGMTFIRHAAAARLSGPGLAALRAAHEAGRPVIFATAHFGNYYAVRIALAAQGMAHATIYKPLENPSLDARYIRACNLAEGEMLAMGRRGLLRTREILRQGGKLALLFDYATPDQPTLPFLGQPTPTATSAADLALKHDALLIPIYGTRQPDGLSFRVEVEEPIPHGDPVEMTRALNASATARIMAAPGQWFWPLQRWKALLAARRAASPRS